LYPTHFDSCPCSGCHASRIEDGVRAPLNAEIAQLKERIADLEQARIGAEAHIAELEAELAHLKRPT